jgi:hypothetical protein
LTCQYEWSAVHGLDFWFSRAMVLVVPVLVYNVWCLREYTNGSMEVVLKPFVIK